MGVRDMDENARPCFAIVLPGGLVHVDAIGLEGRFVGRKPRGVKHRVVVHERVELGHVTQLVREILLNLGGALATCGFGLGYIDEVKPEAVAGRTGNVAGQAVGCKSVDAPLEDVPRLR